MMGGLFGRYARLSGAATHPAGARPSKRIIIIADPSQFLAGKSVPSRSA
jgi:hypothetical protein